MGFLSKLFGGDAGSAAGKPADEPVSALPEPHAAPGAANATNEGKVAPARAAPDSPSAKARARTAGPAPVREPVLTGEHRAEIAFAAPPPRAANLVETAKNPKATARAAREPKPFPAAAQEPSQAPPVPRRAPDSPRRGPQIESSIITSAPALGLDPPRAPAAPRPALGAKPARALPESPRAAAAEPPKAGPSTELSGAAAAPDLATPPRAPMPSVSGEGGLLGSGRRKDRSKSPGFYSNMAPAYGSQVVNPGASPNIKRTAIGLAPPPDPSTEASAADIKPLADEQNGAAPAVSALVVEADGPVASVADVGSGAPDSAPPQALADEIEKEQTAPGVGHTPSRHDPVMRGDIPERDLDLLSHFVMDLGLGLASEAWLGPVREAVARLKAAAAKLHRSALDKALSQLLVELDAQNALGEDRRVRIAQQLVLVDLALPRPVDISGQRLLRERLIVQHLLSELSIAHPLVAQRLRDEGTLTLERFARLGADELAEKVGISPEQADQALFAFREYLLERGRRGPAGWLLGKAQALEQRLLELETSAQLFESVADGDDVMAKREARRRRQADIARVSLFLAEWGEAGILAEFERCSVQGKVTRLKRWLAEIPA